MSGWLTVNEDDEDGDERALVHERLVRDDGLILGAILRFYEHGPTYAWSHRGRIGPCSPAAPYYVAGAPVVEPGGAACDAAARRAVEHALAAPLPLCPARLARTKKPNETGH